MNWRKWLLWIAGGLFGVFLAIQLIPYGHDHENPPVVAEPTWDSAATRALAVRACFDCHSNETKWPWYTNVAPVSWLSVRDVEEGRNSLNFSDWSGTGRHADEAAEVVLEGEMPPVYYTWMHPSARLTDAEVQQLAAGLDASLNPGG
jgi:mono/diheme cytochrome c family protein